MIVRSWRAHATRENAPLYAEHALSQVFPAIAKIATRTVAGIATIHKELWCSAGTTTPTWRS